ncbi:hypothetical protein OURE66S_01136 [Oligella ureolytica]
MNEELESASKVYCLAELLIGSQLSCCFVKAKEAKSTI